MTAPETKPYLLFLAEALSILTSFNKVLQQEDVLIENALDHILEVYTTLLLHFMKADCVRDHDVTTLDIDNPLYHISPEFVVICEEARILVDSPKMSGQRLGFLKSCFNFYYTAAKKMQMRFNFACPVLSCLQFFKPRGEGVKISLLVWLCVLPGTFRKSLFPKN